MLGLKACPRCSPSLKPLAGPHFLSCHVPTCASARLQHRLTSLFIFRSEPTSALDLWTKPLLTVCAAFLVLGIIQNHFATWTEAGSRESYQLRRVNVQCCTCSFERHRQVRPKRPACLEAKPWKIYPSALRIRLKLSECMAFAGVHGMVKSSRASLTSDC